MKSLVGINEELKTIEAARTALSTNPNSKETIKVLRHAKYIAALAMTTLPSDKPLNDARHAVVITLSDLVHALETDPLGGCGCLNRISASISGASAGVRPPRGKAAS